MPVFGSNYLCEQPFSIKNVKSWTRLRLTDEHLEGFIWIVTTEIKPDNETLLNNKQCHASH
jgi:hypothetical protein